MQPMGRLWIMVRVSLAATLLIGAAAPGPAQQVAQAARAAGVYSDSEVKAAFLYHFGTYVQWPSVVRGDATPITIAVLGSPPVASELESFLPGRKIQGRPVQARRIGRI